MVESIELLDALFMGFFDFQSPNRFKMLSNSLNDFLSGPDNVVFCDLIAKQLYLQKASEYDRKVDGLHTCL